MKKLIFMAALALAGCASEAEKAEQEFRIVAERSSNERDKCVAARKVAAAHLREGDAGKYESWNLIAAGNCF